MRDGQHVVQECWARKFWNQGGFYDLGNTTRPEAIVTNLGPQLVHYNKEAPFGKVSFDKEGSLDFGRMIVAQIKLQSRIRISSAKCVHMDAHDDMVISTTGCTKPPIGN